MQSPLLSQTQGAFSHPGPRGEAFWGLEVTLFLLFMVKGFAERKIHSCEPEAQHSTCREGPDGGLPDSLGSSLCLPNSIILAFKVLHLDFPKYG